MILKRLLSNLIDFVIFVCSSLLIFIVSGLEVNTENGNFIFVLTFILVILLPVITLKNTFGKVFVGLNWQNSKHLRAKLITKYGIYFLFVIPAFSILDAILSFPLFNSNVSYLYKTLSLNLFVAFAVTNFIVFVLTIGKAHLLDYFSNLSIEKYPTRKTLFIHLTTIYCFFGTLFITSVIQHKFNFTISSLDKSIKSVIYSENYPTDLHFNGRIFVLKEKTSRAVVPSKPLSFLFPIELERKTIYAWLPKNVFYSDEDRLKICNDLLYYSRLNDLFTGYEPNQTRIFLYHSSQGKFLEIYSNYYQYYFDNNLQHWGIYAGIKSDSTTMTNYIDFANNYLPKKIERLEKEFNLNWREIVNRCEHDQDFENTILQNFNMKINSTVYHNKIKIVSESNSLILEKISVKDKERQSYVGYNFPITDLSYRVNIINFLNNNVFEIDEDLDYLLLLRQETTDKHF